MIKNDYIAPEMRSICLDLTTIMAGSYIEEGKTDGNGSGTFDANARENTFGLIDYSEEEE